MIKKLYTALAALALLGGAGAVTVSALGESSPSVQGVDLDVTPNYVTVTTSVKFDVPNKKVYPHISFTLPTEGRDDNWVYQPLVVLPQVIVQRLESYCDENPVVIYSETDLEPGSTIEVDDTKEGWVMGKE